MIEETMNPQSRTLETFDHANQIDKLDAIAESEPETYVVDADGYYWYECLICDRLLYSEWCVAMARIEATGELVSFCPNHSDIEIHRMTRIVESPVIDILADKPQGN